MEGVNTSTRLPEIGARFHVCGVSPDREPPAKSWAKIRTCVIDNPRDDEFTRRQEVWSYHNRNRGVVKSLLKKLPTVPYRVKRKKMRQKDIETERDRIRETISRLPNFSNADGIIGRDSPGRNFRTRPLGMSKKSEFCYRSRENDNFNRISESEDRKRNIDQNNNNESARTIQTEPLPQIKERPSRAIASKGNRKLEEQSKKVAFSMNDLSAEIDNRSVSAASNSSTLSENAIENYGHTSYGVSNLNSRSVLDVFGNKDKDGSKISDTSKGKQSNSTFKISANHKSWFQRVLGDKELIAFDEYENFARTSKPFNERGSDDFSQNGKIPPEKQYSRSGWNVYYQPYFSKQNNNGAEKNDSKTPRGSQWSNPNKVGGRSIDAKLNDSTYVKQSESEKLRRFDRTQQLQAEAQNRISERLVQRSPERINQLKSQEKTSSSQTQSPNRLIERIDLSRSPDRLGQGQIYSRNSIHRQSKMENFDDVNNSPNASPSPSRFMGEYKLSKSPPPGSTGRYFPIFPTDGTPMRKIGGGNKNKIQKANSRGQPIAIPLQETDTYILS